MILKRKIYKKLLEWKKECQGKKALLIEGARRIGKSTICEEFGKNEYKSFLLIDFAKKDKEVEGYFEKYLNDLDTFFMLLQTHFGTKLTERNSLIIFDEVQMFPQARAAIKYLVADGRYDYIETGSLISIRENVKNIVIPSEERHINMYPLDFEEFAIALEEDLLVEYIKKCFEKREPLERSMHNQAMLLFHQYMLVGGMPMPVVTFIESKKDFTEADREKRDILKLYREDIMKIDAKYRSKVLAIYDQIPGFLSQHEKRVVFKKLQDGSYADQYEETFFWLSDSMISNECFLCNDPNVGLSLNETRSYVKCYMGDTGLLVTQVMKNRDDSDEDLYKSLIVGNLGINQGMILENMVAQMLRASGHDLYFHEYLYRPEGSSREKKYEIDFMTVKKKKICPIEVKSSGYTSHKSFDYLIRKYQLKMEDRYIIYTKDLKYQDGILYLPIYMTMLI